MATLFHPFLTRSKWLLALLLLWSTTAVAQSLPEQLKASRWKKRVVLLYAPTGTNASLRRQHELLAQQQPGLQERDIQVLDVVETQLSAAERTYLRRTLQVPTGNFSVLLIGKDGGVKRRETAPLSTKSLFSTIDVMPMRRQEMLRQ